MDMQVCNSECLQMVLLGSTIAQVASSNPLTGTLKLPPLKCPWARHWTPTMKCSMEYAGSGCKQVLCLLHSPWVNKGLCFILLYFWFHLYSLKVTDLLFRAYLFTVCASGGNCIIVHSWLILYIRGKTNMLTKMPTRSLLHMEMTPSEDSLQFMWGIQV